MREFDVIPGTAGDVRSTLPLTAFIARLEADITPQLGEMMTTPS